MYVRGIFPLRAKWHMMCHFIGSVSFPSCLWVSVSHTIAVTDTPLSMTRGRSRASSLVVDSPRPAESSVSCADSRVDSSCRSEVGRMSTRRRRSNGAVLIGDNRRMVMILLSCCIILLSILPSACAFAVFGSRGRGTPPSSRSAADAARIRSFVGLHLFSSQDAEDDSAANNNNADADADAGDDINSPRQEQRGGTGLDTLISGMVDRDILREARGNTDGAATTNTVAAKDSSSVDTNGSTSSDETVQWDVYVDQSKPSKDRGSGATLDAFVGLAPAEYVKVHPAIIAKARGKGPIVRCIRRVRNDEDGIDVGRDGRRAEQSEAARARKRDDGDNSADDDKDDGDNEDGDGILDAFEVSGVDSVDKVYRILTKHMGLGENSADGKYSKGGLVDATACECLRWNYQGNAHLERNEITAAIECYGKAIATGYSEQEGVVLLMRSTAYLKRSFQHQAELRRAVEELEVLVPAPEALQSLFATAKAHPALANALHSRVVADSRRQERQFRRINYWHSLYEYALLHAAQDSLRATQLLPHYSRTWLRAGDALAELRKLREAARYYERAMEIDEGLVVSLMPVVERLRSSQQFLDEARALGWPEDTLRLSLDVAG